MSAQKSAWQESPKSVITTLAVLVFLVILGVVFLTGGHGKKHSGTDTDATTVSDPLDDPGTATCQQWLDATQADRDDTSGRIVIALKAFDQSDAFAHEFAVDISKDCDAAPTLKLKEVAAGIATLDTDDFPR